MIVIINQTKTAMFNITDFKSVTVIQQDGQAEDEYTLALDQSCILGVYKAYMIRPLIEWLGDNISSHKAEENIVFTMPTQDAFPTEEEIKAYDNPTDAN